MGSGGGGGPHKIGGISGQGGGRILPGGAGGTGELLLTAPRIDVTANVAPGHPDYRPMPPFGSTFDTVFAAPGGGPGQPGQGDGFAVYVSLNPNDGTTSPVTPLSGGGGGWGAAGGAATQFLTDFTTQQGGNPGAAGGKAISTHAHPVTWLGGSNRVYGAIG
jgi:hypothetical protein